MQKTVTTKTHTTGLGAMFRKVMRTAPEDLGTLTKMHDASPAPRLRPLFGGLFEPMFTATAGGTVTKAATPKPVQTLGTKVTPADTGAVRQHVVASQRVDPDFNADDPRHVHAAQLRASAGAHADLLAAIRAVHAAGPTSHGSRSQTPL